MGSSPFAPCQSHSLAGRWDEYLANEELAHQREKDHYARKVAAKKAAEQAERSAILQGTVYEIQPEESEVKKTA